MPRPYFVLPAALFFALAASVFGPTQADEKKDAPDVRGVVRVTDEALRLHREALVIDGHNDLAWMLRLKADLSFDRIDLTRSQKDKGMHTDIPRLRQGGVGAQFWSAWVSAKTRKDGTAVRMTLEQIDVIRRMVAQYPDVFEMASTADDIVRIRKQGKIASMIGVEGGHSIDNSLGVLRCYYDLGVRYMTLTHSETIDWADSATDNPLHNGLTPFGEQVVAEMNRLGMLVDISHVSPDTMRHAIRVSKAPVIASHSSAYAIAAHSRNVPDDVLQLVAKTGGVIMVNFYPGFIVPEGARVTKEMFKPLRELREKYPKDEEYQAAALQLMKGLAYPSGSVHTLVDHIDHIVKTAGIDNVGLGSDYDGINKVPQQLEDVSCYPVITQELLNRGYKRDAILKILGGNALRVLRQAEKVAKK